MRASTACLPWMGSYCGSKSLSRSTPSLLFGRSMMWPLDATTVKLRPRNLVSVRDLVGDSTITSDLADPPARAGAAFLAGLPSVLGARAALVLTAARGLAVFFTGFSSAAAPGLTEALLRA